MTSCGDPERVPDASRGIDGVLLISDAESGQAGYLTDSELTSKGAQFKGGWYTYDDRGDCPEAERADRTGDVFPAMGETYVMTKYADVNQMPPPAEMDAKNEWAIRFWGTEHTLWGAGIGIGLNNSGGLQPYNLQAQGFTGLRFWAKSAAGPVTMMVKIQDKYSEGAAPAGAVECCYLDKAVCGANSCGEMENQGCFAAPNKLVDLTDQWTLYEIPFTDLMRPSWGSYVNGDDHGGEPVALAESYQLQLEVPQAMPFDVYVDNMGFILPGSTAN